MNAHRNARLTAFGRERLVPADGAQMGGAVHCAPRKALRFGPNVLGLQFHPEVDACAGIERWLIGHAAELAAARIDPRALRDYAAKHGRGLREAARKMFTEWLQGTER